MQPPRMPSMRLDGRRALVTGGSRGLGFAAAATLAEAAAHVVLLARDPVQVEAAADALRRAGANARGIALDVTNQPVVTAALAAEAPFDILVNSAGIARHADFTAVAEGDYDAVMAVNVRAAFFLSQAVARRLIEAGRPGSIITISSQMGHVGGPRRSVYCASKWAVEGMTRALAVELGPHRIRVNTVCPTFVETDFSVKALQQEAFRTWVLSKIKLGRLARVEDVMGPVLFLASDAAAMVTGTSLLVDGGWTAE